MEDFKKKLNHMLRFHRQRKFGKTTSFATIDIPNTGKQIFYLASNKGLWISLYYPHLDECEERIEKLYSNK